MIESTGVVTMSRPLRWIGSVMWTVIRIAIERGTPARPRLRTAVR